MAVEDQQFCLRWNNHQTTLISVFENLLENGVLVDCTLAAEGQFLNAHKVVLSACSPYLQILLSQHTEKHPIVILKDVTFNELKSMLDYMYKGEVNITQDQLGTFLKSAESLQIKGLTDNGTEGGDGRDVGSTAQKRQDPPPQKIPSAKPPIPQPRTQSQLPISSGLTIEQRRASSQLSTDSPRDGSISPSLRKRRCMRRTSNGDDSNLTSNDTSNSCELPNQAQSIPLASSVPSPVTMPSPIVPPTVNPKTEFNRLDASNFNSVPPESGLLKEKIEPSSEPLLEPKTEYLDYLNNDDNSVEDLTLDDDDDMDMSQPGPSQSFSQWHMNSDQTGTDEVFTAAQESVNSQDSRKFGLNPNFRKLNLEDGVNNMHTCPNCSKVYNWKGNLQRHLKLECGKLPNLQCKFCVFITKHKSSLRRHLEFKHSYTLT